MKIKIIKKANPLAESFAQSLQKIASQVEIRKLSIIEALLQFMEQEGINRSTLAERMGVGPSRITKMLSGDENLTIDTLVRAGHAVGADLVQTFVPQGHKAQWLHYPRQQSGKQSAHIEIDNKLTKIHQVPSPQLDVKKPAEHDVEDAA